MASVKQGESLKVSLTILNKGNAPAKPLKALIDVYGNNDTKIIETGIRPGEKIDEVLVSRYEAVNSYVYDGSYYLILPVLYIDGLAEHYEYCNLEKVSFFEYSSNSHLSNIEKLKELLRRGGFID